MRFAASIACLHAFGIFEFFRLQRPLSCFPANTNFWRVFQLMKTRKCFSTFYRIYGKEVRDSWSLVHLLGLDQVPEVTLQ